jgi:phosphatidylserine/phosphatidylglycerophosphate/cardiolipin synthase-like enzyme
VPNTNLSDTFPSGEAIQVLKAPDALASFQLDLTHHAPVYGWIYLLDPLFAVSLLSNHLEHSEIFVLVDNRQRRHAATLVNTFPRFHAWSWAYNRTLHAKTFLFPDLQLTWISSQNLTLGSFNLSYNHAVRIHSRRITHDLLRDWQDNQQHSKIIPAKQKTGHLPTN